MFLLELVRQINDKELEPGKSSSATSNNSINAMHQKVRHESKLFYYRYLSLFDLGS